MNKAEENLDWSYFVRAAEAGKSFFCARYPHQACRYGVQHVGTPTALQTIDALEKRSGWVIAPFAVSSHEPIWMMQPDETGIIPQVLFEKKSDKTSVRAVKWSEEEKNLYMDRFSVFHSALVAGDCDKLVLSRIKTIEAVPVTVLFSIFQSACVSYPDSFVYLQFMPQTGFWLGATPEILLSGNAECWHTMALAGTQSASKDVSTLVWDDKNRQEQEYVAEYIRYQLKGLKADFEETLPHPVLAGHVAHLRSDFSFTLPDDVSVVQVLNKLHPTPAVCGLPKENAYEFILANEGYERSYYSGFVGCFDGHGQTDLYVNLRCLSQKSDVLSLYAGGGLLTHSQPESEWEETQKKLWTLYALINN